MNVFFRYCRPPFTLFSLLSSGLWAGLLLVLSPLSAQEVYWSRAFADAIMDRHANINDMTGKRWEYNNSIVLIGIEKLYYETGHPAYLEYIRSYVDDYVDEQGRIPFNKEDNNLDHLHPGWLTITLWEETGLEKYKLAAQTIRQEFDNQPRTPSGGFWHKQRYPNQMWVDGVYMAEPFLIRYGSVFGELDYAAGEATQQAILLAENAYDSTLNLILHAWDESKEAAWADPVTGRSSEVWSRGMGWYLMALVDILDFLPDSHPDHPRMIQILQGLAVGVQDFQDQESGLWFQVVDKGEKPDNWLETSGSAMFVYALKKAIDQGYIDSLTYTPVVNRGWAGLQDKITLDGKGQPVINHSVRGMGVRNGYENYVAEEIVSTPPSRFPHGYCGILLAASAMEFPLPPVYQLQLSVEGSGEILSAPDQPTGYMEGEEVLLFARAEEGWTFAGWSGDTVSQENPLRITFGSDFQIRAEFQETTTSIREVPEPVDVRVYPGVARESVRLSIRGITGPYRWLVTDSHGKLIREGRGQQEEMDIALSDWSSGLYHLQVAWGPHRVTRSFFKK